MQVARVQRLLRLMSLLRSGRVWDAEGLSQELGVSRRTFFRDLGLLEEAGVPTRFERSKSAYALRDAVLLPPVYLSLDETMAMMLVTRRFLSRQVHPQYRAAVSAAIKIESNLPRGLVEHCGSWIDGVAVVHEPGSSADAVSGVFLALQAALADHHRVFLQYDSAQDQGELSLLVEPYRLVYMSRGWYLLARSLEHEAVRTFKLDRILRIESTSERFVAESGFSEGAHFGNAWRMIPEGRIHEVRLRFSKTVAHTVEEVLWHRTQATHRLADGRLEFEARVDGLSEITAWILGYGEHVEVLSPKELRDRVRERAERVVAAARALDRENTESCAPSSNE